MVLGKKAFSARRLTREFVCGLDPARTKGGWTAEVLRVLRELGKKKHFYISPDPRAKQRGYLLDMIWQRKERDEKRSYPDVVLAIESGRDPYRKDLDDFEKLMHVKAPQKLLVFRSIRRAGDGQVFISDVEEKYMAVFSQHICGEEYILVEFPKDERAAFRYRYVVPRNGKNSRVKFREMKPPISY